MTAESDDATYGQGPDDDAWDSWDDAPGGDDTSPGFASADIIPTPEGPLSIQPHDAAHDAAFTALLLTLRSIPGPCAPPIGAGSFDILYASEREVVVWFAPAREGAEQREVVIPASLVHAAWSLTLHGEPVDEAALRALAAGASGGAWLLALLAQVPGVEVQRRLEPDSSADVPTEAVALRWRGAPPDA